jgi:hypothetical protein
MRTVNSSKDLKKAILKNHDKIKIENPELIKTITKFKEVPQNVILGLIAAVGVSLFLGGPVGGVAAGVYMGVKVGLDVIKLISAIGKDSAKMLHANYSIRNEKNCFLLIAKM